MKYFFTFLFLFTAYFLTAQPIPDSVKITPNGDTVRYFSQTKTGTYTYKVPVIVISYKVGGTLPPDTIVPPDTITPPTQNTYNLSFQALGIGDPDINRPGAGFEQWHDRNDVSLGYTPLDVYYRFVSTRIATATRGVYNWTYLDNLINQAKMRGQKFSFGIMTSYPEGTTNEGLINIDGGTASYPSWLQSAMSGEWKINGSWVPNYNDPVYLAWVLELNQAINAHLISTGNFNVINSIDIRSYGSWGEWHSANLANNFTVDQYPSGTFPTATSLKKIVDAYIQGFPDIQLSCMIAAFDAHWLNNTWNPAEIAYYVLTQKNNRGMIGWRRDQWGATDQYLTDYLKNNNRSFNGLVFKDSIVPRYKTAPVTGEPPAWNPNNYSDLQNQVNDYHPTSIGNGNYGSVNATVTSVVKSTSKSMGYRLAPTTGQIKTGNGNIEFIINWQNQGKSPTYDNWNVIFELVNSNGQVVKSFTSKFKPRLFMGKVTVDETFVAGVTGTFTARMKIVDPGSYRKPMPLQIVGQVDGLVLLANGVKL